MAQAMQFIFFLYLLSSVAATDVFKLVNSSVQLDVQKEVPEDSSVKWTKIESFNKTRIVVQSSGTLSKSYKDRGEFNGKTRSLTLKNLQKNDSGIYVADAENEYVTNVAKYQLYVLDPVEKPVLTFSHQQSNGTCNATFICKSQNFSVTSNCYSDHCDNKTEKESGNFLLSLYIKNGSIICNHSNPVSLETATMEMKHLKKLCLSERDKEPPAGPLSNIPVISVVIVIVIVIFIVCLGFFLFKKLKGTTESDNTVYEVVKEGNKTETIEMSEKQESPGTVYCTVGKPANACSNDESTVSTPLPGNKAADQHNHSTPDDTPNTNQGAGNNYESVEMIIPQTIYATVNKNGKM